MTDSSEAEKAWEEYWKGKYGLKFEHIYDNSIERETWLAAWSACAEKAAGVAENLEPKPFTTDAIIERARIAAEIRRRLGGKG